jgi:hypothetical protein
MVDRIEIPMSRLRSGVQVLVNGDSGEVMYEGELL